MRRKIFYLSGKIIDVREFVIGSKGCDRLAKIFCDLVRRRVQKLLQLRNIEFVNHLKQKYFFELKKKVKKSDEKFKKKMQDIKLFKLRKIDFNKEN